MERCLVDVPEKFMELMDFSNGQVYMVSAVARTKYAQLAKKDRMLYREVVHSLEELPNALNNMAVLSMSRNLKIYIYISANARSTIKAYKDFNMRFANYSCQAMFGDEGYKRPITRLDKEWYSALMQPECKATDYFVVDIDTHDAATLKLVRERINDYHVPIRGKVYQAEILLEQPTRNGCHFLTTGFDPSILVGISDVGVQKDTMLFLKAIGFED
jgi:hypothetical protein